jgi:hypothetical protein
MASTGPQRVHAHVQLEPVHLRARVFLANYEIEIENGAVQPIEYQGQTFQFSHKSQISEYSGASTESFVFVKTRAT